MANYDVDLQYHPNKINVVPDALSRKLEDNLLVQLTQQTELPRELIQPS